jgi:secretion/DNA translocation related TadE-like protein
MKERGSATIVAAGLLAVTMAVGLGLLAAVQLVTARALAVTAADAAALAAAPMTFPPLASGTTPVAGARSLAAANHARLIRCVCPIIESFEPRSVEVVVEVPVRLVVFGRVLVRAASRAEFVP